MRYVTRCWLLALALALANAANGRAQAVTFKIPPTLPTGAKPADLAIADFDQDGRQDLAIANSWSDTVTVYYRLASGGFGTAATVPVGAAPIALAVGNLNGDAFPDLAVANRNDDTVSILLNDGLGALAGGAVTIGASPDGVALADMDVDGRIDLLVVDHGAGTISILLGNGNGTFGSPTSVTTQLTADRLAIGLFNGDAYPDVAARGIGEVVIHLGSAGGVLGPPATIPLPGFGGKGIAVGHLNGDSALDLAVTVSNAYTVAVLLGNGNGGFAPPVSYPTGRTPSSVAIADLDGNGTADLAVTAAGDHAVVTLNGNGNGTFGPPVKYGTGGHGPLGIAVAELDGNPGLDVALANYDSDTVSIHAGLGGGVLDGIPIYPVGDWPIGVAIEDVNQDGNDDVATTNIVGDDVSVLLGNGNGTLGPATALPMGDSPRYVSLIDVDLDARPDLVVMLDPWPAAGSVAVRLGQGDGTFGPVQVSPVGVRPDGLAVTDVNGDGRKDVLTNVGDNLALLLGSGTGTFGPPTLFPMGHFPESVATASFDGNGRVDVVVANAGSSSVTDRRNDGLGGLGAPTHIAVSQSPMAVVTGAFGGDSLPDIAVCGYSGKVDVLLNTGGGTFAPAQSFPFAPGSTCWDMIAVDLDRDGRDDLAIAEALDERLTVLVNDGQGGFASPPQHFAAGDVLGIAAGSLNGDLKPDLVVANNQAGTVELFVNTTPPPAADLSVTKTDFSDTATPGTTVTYTVQVTNDGPTTLDELRLVDAYPPEFLSPPTYLPAAGSYDASTTRWTGLSLGPGQTVAMEVAGLVTGTATGTMTNTVTVAPPAGFVDPNPGNDTAADTDVLIPLTDVGITLTDGLTRVVPLQPVTYTSVVTNAGPSHAVGVTVVDVFPGALENVTWTCAGASGATCPAGNGVGHIAQVVAIPVGGRLTYTSTGDVTASATGLFVNTAFLQIPFPTQDPDFSNNVAHDLDTLDPLAELTHGTSLERSLAATPAARTDLFYVQQRPFSSYEVIVDSTSGDIGGADGVRLERLADVPTAALQTSAPVGVGPSRVLRWANATGVPVASQLIRVTSASCGTDCGPDDTYRVRMYDTTFSIARFNNTGTQATVLILQNPTGRAVRADVHLWHASGLRLASVAVELAPKQTLVTNLSVIVGGNVAGSITITHDGGYGALVGKTVALELSTGLSFDSPMLPRPR
jgi:uncharacterized repeat protein (TIGR01451 family)